MRIVLNIIDKRFAINRVVIKSVLRQVLNGERAANRSVDIIYCRDREIIALNRKFRGKNRSTDVLAFELSDADDSLYLGEVYVNLQMARRQARAFDVPYPEEVKRLTIHGVLHLLGFDDDTAFSRSRMWARQEGYLNNGKK